MKNLVLLIVLIISTNLTNAQFIMLNKHVYSPGERIIVNFSSERDFPSDAWIGIIPTSVPHGSEAVNDKYDLSYQYLKNGTRGTYYFTAPQKEGSYDFRYHDSDDNGKEIASTLFEVSVNPSQKTTASSSAVTNSPVSSKYLTLPRTNFKPGESISLQFTAPSSFASNAWIGIIPSSVTHGSEANNDKYDLTYQYLKKRTSGTLIFKAPTKEGNYDFRMNDNDKSGKEVASVSFVVSNSNSSVGSHSSDLNQTNIAGTYQTDFNEMNLQINGTHVTGTYKYADGKVDGILSGNKLTGTWTQNNGKGRIEFIFNSDFTAFTGKWGYGNKVPTSKWNGHK